jgi:hypothetical protein
MKRLHLSLFVLLFSLSAVHAQEKLYNISFADSPKPFTRNKESDQIIKVTLKTKILKKDVVKGFTLNVEIDEDSSSLSRPGYELDFKPMLLTDLKDSYTGYLVIKKDSVADRSRNILLKLSIKDDKGQPDKRTNNEASTTKLALYVNGINPDLEDYGNLAYIGTNFDLVDGPKAKNLFFAINIFQSPDDIAQKAGFNVTLYGNRAFTNSYNNGLVRYTSKIVGKGNNTAMIYQSQGEETVDRVTDNLGAAFYPILNLYRSNNTNRLFQLFYAPQAEFIWRRTTVTTSYKNSVLVDSTLLQNRPITGTIALTNDTETKPINVYDVNIGFLGFLLKHQTKNISVRLNTAVGVNFSYNSTSSSTNVNRILTSSFDRTTNCFFSSRLWITEPQSGLTVGAEVYNNIFKNHQPYYNVTLSKAIIFGNLGKIFSPITTR